MALGVDLLLGELHVVDVVAAMRQVVIHHIAKKSMEVVEPATAGVTFWIQPQMPLADEGRVVAGTLQHAGECDGILMEIPPVVFRMGSDDSRYTDAVGIAARQQRCPARRAHGGIGVEMLEADAVAGNAIHVRRLDVWPPMHGYIPIAVIVRQNDEDVGPC